MFHISIRIILWGGGWGTGDGTVKEAIMSGVPIESDQGRLFWKVAQVEILCPPPRRKVNLNVGQL